jgi:hypothetical protein
MKPARDPEQFIDRSRGMFRGSAARLFRKLEAFRKLRTPLKEGLTKTIAYFEELLKIPSVQETLNVSEK